MERFRLAAGWRVNHTVKGAPEALTEVMAGHVDVYFSPITPALRLSARKLRALAVGGAKRWLPARRAGHDRGRLSEFDFDFWVGLFAPEQTPHDIVAKLIEETPGALFRRRR